MKKSSSFFFQALNLNDHDFEKINVSGNNVVKTSDIIAVARSFDKKILVKNSQEYQILIQSLIQEIKRKLPRICNVVITRSLPNDLNISVSEYQPFAIWQNDGKKFIIDKDGNAAPFEDLEEFKNLIILSGSGANLNAKSLFNIFAIDPVISANVYSAIWIGNRRWDILLNNGLIIKLPESDISEAWKNLVKIYNLSGSTVNLKMIDLRIKNKIYLEYQDSTMKQLKNL